jgi:hypothetical protein
MMVLSFLEKDGLHINGSISFLIFFLLLILSLGKLDSSKVFVAVISFLFILFSFFELF